MPNTPTPVTPTATPRTLAEAATHVARQRLTPTIGPVACDTEVDLAPTAASERKDKYVYQLPDGNVLCIRVGAGARPENFGAVPADAKLLYRVFGTNLHYGPIIEKVVEVTGTPADTPIPSNVGAAMCDELLKALRNPSGPGTTGVTIVEQADGTRVITLADGQIITEKPGGTRYIEAPGGMRVTESPDGNIHCDR